MRNPANNITLAIVFAVSAMNPLCVAQESLQRKVKNAVDGTIPPLMAKYSIPGVAVGVTVRGRSYFFSYGLASVETRRPVTSKTLFEIGSVSKAFTATLASYAQVTGQLSLSDPVSKYLPSLQASKFGNVSLMNLGTHTPGGLPLQVPGSIQNVDELVQYFKNWEPTYEPGTYRTYANPSIGMLGLITAKSMGEDFTALMETRLFPMLGMTNSYINVPESKMVDCAQGYTSQNTPIRMAPGLLSSEAYGIKTTASDMVHFLEANMNLVRLDKKLQRAVRETHTGYFKDGPMTQDLIWEQYKYPVALKSLLEGNSSAIIFNPTPVIKNTPPEKPRKDVWINKTGSTNGFGAYVAFVPKKQYAVVILANKNYPVEERVAAAYKIIAAIGDAQGRRRWGL